MRKFTIIMSLVSLLIVSVACDASGSDHSGVGGDGAPTETVAYKLAVVDGDASEEGAFQEAIDCIMATGIQGAETEEKVGDTLYASWQQSSQETSLLEWAQILCSG